RGAPPGVPHDLRAAHPRAWPDDPGPGAALGRGGRGVALHGARLGRAAHRRDQPRADVGGAPGVPPAGPGGDRMGPRHDPGGAASGMTDGQPPTPVEPWEVFRQEKDGEPMRHGGSVMAPDAELATHYARELFGRRQESVRLWIVR